MKLISWNVNGRVGDAARRQIKEVLRREPDVIALQEVTGRPDRAGSGNYPIWCEALTDAGYSVVSTIDLFALPYPEPPYPRPPFPERWNRSDSQVKRAHFNLIAARDPIAVQAGLTYASPEEAMYATPEKHLAVKVKVEGSEAIVHNTHLPPGVSRGVIKVHHFEAVRRRVDRDRGTPLILCGDFNAPAAEDDEGPRIERGGPWPEEIQDQWIAAEKRALENPNLRDVYRDVHQPGRPFPGSHYTGRKGRQTARRYDYIFASEHFETESCEYLTDWLGRDGRRQALSDHAAVEAELGRRRS